MPTETLIPPTRAEALTRLRDFVPHAGRDYASLRNYDLPGDGHPHVSRLSPYLRHRLVTEAEVVEAVLGRHSPTAADKFLQEVFWRTYWKGWLELRPGVWGAYRRALEQALARLDDDADLRARVADAEAGKTGLDAFDAWMHELVTTGYLHNHARMWAASIWIFTLDLPWELGADMFLRHLLDGDPASNTLSWRWVAGLQTHGKHYLARASNIAKYTRDRHRPGPALDTQAPPLKGPAHPAPRALPHLAPVDPAARTAILLTEEDLSPGFLVDHTGPDLVSCAALVSIDGRSPRPVGAMVRSFTQGAVADCLDRFAGRFGGRGPQTAAPVDIVTWARDLGLEQVVTAYAPTGPAATRLRTLRKALSEHDITLVSVIRPYDRAAWPHATHGFFRFRKKIPELVELIGDNLWIDLN